MILHYFKKKENIEKNKAEEIYKIILYKSNILLNENNFFKKKDYNVSFELISIFIVFYFRINIQYKINNFKKINENLIQLFISDLDESLRSKGIGDMSIGKYVKSYVKKFYFRLSKFQYVYKKNENIDEEELIKYLKHFNLVFENFEAEAAKVFIDIFKNITSDYK